MPYLLDTNVVSDLGRNQPLFSAPSHRNDAQEGTLILRQQPFYASIQRGQLAMTLHCGGQQYGISNLPVSLKADAK
ncbi:MAG: hypothetical protein OXF47_05995 [Nitrospira sp.]|nr:hypothetical protein [Nitrospira sp.]